MTSVLPEVVNQTTDADPQGAALLPFHGVDGVSVVVRGAAGPIQRPLHILFAFAHAGFIRNFRGAIELLAQKGAAVTILLSRPHETIGVEDYEFLCSGASPCDVLAADPEAFPTRNEQLRILEDVLHYARSEFDGAEDLHARLFDLQEPVFSAVEFERLTAFVRSLSPEAREAARAFLADLDDIAAPPLVYDQILHKLKPHLVVVSPYVHFASRQVELVKAARRLGAATMLAVASWDNLTNKGRAKIRPDTVAVWNDAMAEEARRLHGFPDDAVHVVGASVFDPWFDRAPRLNRDEFLTEIGCLTGQRLIVYLCSSTSIAGGQEDSVIKQWLRALRVSENPLLRKANVLIRPHPMARARWQKLLEGEGDVRNATVWPVAPKHPADAATEAQYFDTLYHADAVVGLNTSGMLEAAILNKPVFTFTQHDARTRQTGNLHFAHLRDSQFVTCVETIEELNDRLAESLAKKRADPKVTRRFVRTFLRPLSYDTPASAYLAKLILAKAAAVQQAERDSEPAT